MQDPHLAFVACPRRHMNVLCIFNLYPSPFGSQYIRSKAELY